MELPVEAPASLLARKAPAAASSSYDALRQESFRVFFCFWPTAIPLSVLHSHLRVELALSEVVRGIAILHGHRPFQGLYGATAATIKIE